MGLCEGCRSKCDAAAADGPAPIVFGEDAPAANGYIPELASQAIVTASHKLIPFHPVPAHPASPPAHVVAPMQATFLTSEESDRYMRVTVEGFVAYTAIAVAAALFIFHLGTTQKS